MSTEFSQWRKAIDAAKPNKSEATEFQGNATPETLNFKQKRSSRRKFLAQAGMAGIGALALGQMSATAGGSTTTPNAGFGRFIDADIFNFALNLEYLEAEFYLRAAFGTTLGSADISGRGNQTSSTTPGNVIGVSPTPAGDKVLFQSDLIRQYAEEIAEDELAHVRLLRSALGDFKVARPTIDIGPAFSAAAVAAGIIPQGQTFNPYANDTNFLLAAFIFEDVGVTAYRGALTLLNQRANISAAGGLLGVEAYHAAEVRTVLFGLAFATQNQGLLDTVQKISDLRDAADGDGSGAGNRAADSDQGIVLDSSANIVPTDSNGLVYARTLQQVLNIVYLTTAPLGTTSSGGFFPNGLNGLIR